MLEYQMLINGKLENASANEWIEVLNPFNNIPIGRVPKATKADVQKALEAAQEAQLKWRRLPAQKRGELVRQLADILLENQDELAHLLTSEHGKPLHEAIGEVQGAAGFLQYAAESARRIEGELIASEKQDEQIWIQRVPYGVTVGIVAWNFPLALAARKLGNALVTGNSMIIKPPSETPLTVMRFAQLVAEKSEIPQGVLQFITGSGREAGDALVRNDIVRLVTLTGSTAAGLQVFKAASENCVDVRLELGGKAPFVVMEDADVEKAAEAAVIARFSNCGQICTCNERMYIHESVYDQFVEKLLEGVRKLRVGDPMQADTDMGPKVNRSEVEKIQDLVNRSLEQGAKILLDMTPKNKEEFPTPNGNWLYPMVLEVTDNANPLMQEEIFGPVLPVMKISGFDEAMTLCNECKYGLSSYLFTNNAKYIMRMIQELDFGEVYVNRENGELLNAFHNGYKLSGTGGEDGEHGLQGYLQKKTVYMNYNIR